MRAVRAAARPRATMARTNIFDFVQEVRNETAKVT